MPLSFDSVHEQHFAAVLRFAYRLLGDVDLADDVAQEAFVRLLESEVGDDGARLWLFRVAGNLARDHRRSLVRRARLMLRWHPRRGATDPAHAEDALTARAVHQALQRLSESERRILLLKEEGLSYAEIAAVAGIAESSVGALLTRARQRFREAYEHG